jgi:Arc/MetJ-type ribon-helix-helix transcriptional regulator
MPNQENPSTHQLRVRVTEELYRQLEVLAARRGFGDVSALVRATLYDLVSDIQLTAADYRLIADRVAKREEALRAR